MTSSVSTLLDADGARAALAAAGVDAASVIPNYIRLKPGAIAIVGFLISDSVPGYIRLWDRALTDSEVARWSSRQPVPTALGPSIRLLPQGEGALFLFPSDGGLRSLDRVVDGAWLKRLLGRRGLGGTATRISSRQSRFAVLRYKPERRVVIDANLRVLGIDDRRRTRLVVRHFADDRARQLFGRVQALRHSDAAPHCPEPIAVLGDARMYVEGFVPGTTVADALVDGSPTDGAAVAEAVLALHRSDAAVGPRHRPVEMLERTIEGLRTMTLVAPELSALVEDVAARMQEWSPRDVPAVPIHGDLHLDQVVVGPDGPTLVDWERAGVGDPLFDVGSLTAALRATADERPEKTDAATRFEQSFLGRYLEHSASRPERELSFAIAAGLAEQALLRFRRLDPQWRRRVASILQRAGSELGGGRWEVLYSRVYGTWPCTLSDAAGQAGYGIFDPATGVVTSVRPEDDPKLPSLAGWLRRGELVGYRVGQRAVIRTNDRGRVRYVKVVTPETAELLVRRAETIERVVADAGTDFPRVPRLIDASVADGYVVLEELAGASMHALGARGELSDDCLASVARALVRFHDVPAADLDLPPTPVRALDRWVDAVTAIDPGQERPYREVLARVAALPSPAQAGTALAHGDLHDKNVLVDGRVVGVLDLDEIHAGDPAEDIGNLAAHLVLRSVQRDEHPSRHDADAERLLAAYADAGGTTLATDPVVARTLFRMACLYHLRRRWQTVTPNLLDGATRWAARAEAVIPSSR